MEDAHRLSAEAMDMIDMAQEKYDTAEEKIIAKKTVLPVVLEKKEQSM